MELVRPGLLQGSSKCRRACVCLCRLPMWKHLWNRWEWVIAPCVRRQLTEYQWRNGHVEDQNCRKLEAERSIRSQYGGRFYLDELVWRSSNHTHFWWPLWHPLNSLWYLGVLVWIYTCTLIISMLAFYTSNSVMDISDCLGSLSGGSPPP